MVVTGEDSGDAHAAELVKALKSEWSGMATEFFGATGRRLRAEGVRSVVRSDDFGIVGVPEVLRAAPMFLRVLKRLTDVAVGEEPDLAILVDFPEFNLKLAKRLKKKGVRVVYYISPQLWAWRSYRFRAIRDYVDLMITILPFENKWYASRGVSHTVYVGHPLAGKVESGTTRSDFREKHGYAAETPVIALLPGSRAKEIERNFPLMLKAAGQVKKRRPEARFAVVLAKSKNKKEIERFTEKAPEAVRNAIKVFESDFYDVLNASDAAAVTSGTATLETALVGTPQVIVYRTSALNYFLLRPLVNIEQFGLANLIAGRQVFREFLQNDFTAESLSDELIRLLEPETNQEHRNAAKEIRIRLGTDDAATLAAKAIVRFAEL